MNKQTPPLEINLKRGGRVESKHIAHAVITDSRGRILMCAGNPNYETYMRSALKPFQVLPFISSGASEQTSCCEKGIAIACASHSGSSIHAREVFKILWDMEIDVTHLKCPIPATKKSKLEHNCSGKHASFLATCKKMNWPIESYLDYNHPIQKEIFRRVANLINISNKELFLDNDDCGAPTIFLPIYQMALLYAHLANSNNPEFEQIKRAILKYPEYIAGKGKFDTEIIKQGHNQIISKSGSEGIQCLARTGAGIGIAIKVEDGSKRAKQVAALHVLNQLEWITPSGMEAILAEIIKLKSNVKIEVTGKLRFLESQQ